MYCEEELEPEGGVWLGSLEGRRSRKTPLGTVRDPPFDCPSELRKPRDSATCVSKKSLGDSDGPEVKSFPASFMWEYVGLLRGKFELGIC